MSSGPSQSAESKALERAQVEREKQLRIENAKQTTKAFSDNIAYRKKLRGIFSLMSGGFGGFALGSSPVSSAGGGMASSRGAQGTTKKKSTGIRGGGGGSPNPAGGGSQGYGSERAGWQPGRSYPTG